MFSIHISTNMIRSSKLNNDVELHVPVQWEKPLHGACFHSTQIFLYFSISRHYGRLLSDLKRKAQHQVCATRILQHLIVINCIILIVDFMASYASLHIVCLFLLMQFYYHFVNKFTNITTWVLLFMVSMN